MEAAERFGCDAVGIDLFDDRLSDARALARAKGVDEKCEFLVRTPRKHAQNHRYHVVAVMCKTTGIMLWRDSLDNPRCWVEQVADAREFDFARFDVVVVYVHTTQSPASKIPLGRRFEGDFRALSSCLQSAFSVPSKCLLIATRVKTFTLPSIHVAIKVPPNCGPTAAAAFTLQLIHIAVIHRELILRKALNGLFSLSGSYCLVRPLAFAGWFQSRLGDAERSIGEHTPIPTTDSSPGNI